MSVKSILSNITSSVNKYGKSIKSNVNKVSIPRLKFVETLFTSRLFLYFLVFVMSVVLFTYVNTRDITSVVALLLIGFLASFFTKNMAVLLSIALVFTWLLKYAMKLRYEGFEGQEEEEKDKDDKEEQPQDNKKETMTDKESSDSDKSSESDKSSDKEQEKELKALKKDYESFEEIQKNILGGVKEINKELDKAETFINKYERYKNKHGGK